MTMNKVSKSSYKYLIVSADDLGIQYCFNHAIQKGHWGGLITSTNLRANGLALDHALAEVIPSCPNLGLGVHICLNEGQAVAPAKNIPLLAGQRGYFSRSQGKGFLFLMMNRNNREVKSQVEIEIRAQIEKLMKHIKLDHLNGHQHIHAIPWIFELVVKLAREYHIPFVRLPREPFDVKSFKLRWPNMTNFLHYLNLQRWRKAHQQLMSNSAIRTNDIFYGLLHSSAMTEAVAKCHLSNNNGGRTVEILFHPVMEGDPIDKRFIDPAIEAYCQDPNRDLELEAVLSHELKSEIERLDYKLTNYRELSSRELTNDRVSRKQGHKESDVQGAHFSEPRV